MKVLLTGAAGFIGYHVAQRLLKRGIEVVGLDSINDYYDPQLKQARLQNLGIQHVVEGEKIVSSSDALFSFYKANIEDNEGMKSIFANEKFDRVIHLAAYAGVRYSIEQPHVYIQANVVGFLNILEGCRHNHVQHLAYASSSSVYGLNKKMPLSVHDNVDHPISLYAATKKSNELMAHSYSYLYNMSVTGLRFFNVYGPWGRPDSALFKFTKAILNGDVIDVYNHGEMIRDFTFVDDIAEGVVQVCLKEAKSNLAWDAETPDPGTSPANYRIYNIGRSSPVNLMDYIKAIEKETGKKAIMRMMPMQPGDISTSFADVQDLIQDIGYAPTVNIDEGVKAFVDWYIKKEQGKR